MESVPLPDYAELHALSNFSFQRGASHPAELVERALQLGYKALALTDECSVAGMVRAWRAAQACGLRLLPGSEFALTGPLKGLRVVALARDLQGWGDLCEFISAARQRAPKGSYCVDESSPWRLLGGCEILLAPSREHCCDASDAIAVRALLAGAIALFDAKNRGHLWLAVELHAAVDDSLWLQSLRRAGAALSLPLVAAGDVHMHARSRKPLQDVVTAIGRGLRVDECGWALQPQAERRLRSRARLASLYPPELLAATLEVVRRCRFDLGEIRYRYPLETVLPGMTALQTLAWLSWQGAQGRYPQGIPAEVAGQIHKELDLIGDCGYEMYFLTVHDIVRYARSEGILCQGRGSAANSVVCYCLGITAVPPEQSHLLFERFISRERREPPDIDVDFEHSRREEVIQYIYGKYGRERAALTAVVASYRTRSALRDVGKALGVDARLVDAFAKDHHWFDAQHAPERLHELAGLLGLRIAPRQVALWLELAAQLRGFPRHLSQHVGGFVLTQGKLTRLVPTEPAAMDRRTIIQWDKDDLDDMKLLKVDVLALGMLSALRRCLDMRAALRGERWGLADLPREDAATYAMIAAADTVGTFQIESRAQMSMLPRLRPATFYDLVVEVAIVRPGPIQGGMVHPYLQARERRARGEPLPLEKEELKDALERTLGIPIFQEQVMQIAMIAARFDAAEADALRRSMAAWKRTGGVHRFKDKVIEGMVDNGYRREFAEAIFQQMLGFGEYGFPESHAYSFAMLAYASAWLKRHEPAIFLAALLDSQPMGFYSPSQLVQDARRHGVRVLPIDVAQSDWGSSLQGELQPIPGVTAPQPAVRLGLGLVANFSRSAAERLLAARAQAPFAGTEDLALRSGLDRQELQALAAADALRALSGHRRQQMWDAAAQLRAPALLRAVPTAEPALELPEAGEGEEIGWDYAAVGLTLRRHPLALLRPRLARWQLRTAHELREARAGERLRACGIVTVRQRPPTARGTLFITLEDETGTVNLVVWARHFERLKTQLLHARLLAVEGVWQSSEHWGRQSPTVLRQEPGHAGPGEGMRPVVCHLVVHRARDLSGWLGKLSGPGLASRDFH